MTDYSGEEVAELVGPDLASNLALDDGPYTDDDLDALTDALGDAAALADDVAEGDVAALATLLSPGFLTTHTEFSDFSDFLATSPWTRDTVGHAFSAQHAEADAGGDAPGDAGGDAPGDAGGDAPGDAGGDAPGDAGGDAPGDEDGAGTGGGAGTGDREADTDTSAPQAATTSAFLTRTTSFRTPAEMVQEAILYRCRQALADD